MGVYSAGPSLLTVWVSWLKGGLVLRVLGVPIALFAWHLEVYGYSQTSLVLQRLSRRIRIPTLFLFLQDHDMSHIFFVGGADVMDHLTEQNTRAMRKRASTQNEVGRFLASGVPSTPMAPPPAKQFETPSNSTTTNTLSELSSIPSTCNSDSMTYSEVAKQGKRLSLHFPIQPAAGSTSPRSTPRSRPQSITTPITSPEIAPSPTEGNFLTVLAAQERRVFELKEELVKAEQDLEQLKRHWATHEAMKKRNDVRRVQQLQPLTTPFPNFTAVGDDDEDGSPVSLQKEMERRKALLSNTKTSQRKVFSGSRHTRTLSLLSPDKTNYSPSFPQPADIRQSLDEQVKRAPLARSSTTPDIATQVASVVKDDKYDLGGIQRDVILRTGKQMASDFKDGLLTFIEDLRQATVGEEAINGAQGNALDAANGQQTIKQQPGKANQKGRSTLNRANSSKKVSKDESPDLIDIGGSFWKEHGLNEPRSASPAKVTKALNGGRTPQKVTQKLSDDFEDSWDTWDTPNDKYIAASSSNSSDSDGPASPTSARSSPRTSTRYVQRRLHPQPALTKFSSAGFSTPASEPPARHANHESIPWPALTKLSPTQLKRTASHLMKEWEKTLTPPPESRQATASGDYIGRSPSPVKKD